MRQRPPNQRCGRRSMSLRMGTRKTASACVSACALAIAREKEKKHSEKEREEKKASKAAQPVRNRNGRERADGLLGRERRIQYAHAGSFARRLASPGRRSQWIQLKFVFGELVRHAQNATPWMKNCLEQAEDRLDGDPRRNGAVRRITRRREFPAANGLRRALIQSQPNPLNDTNLHGAPVGANQNLQRHPSLQLRFACFVGVFRVRAVRAPRIRDARPINACRPATPPPLPPTVPPPPATRSLPVGVA